MDYKKMGENLMLEEDEFKELLVLFVETGTADVERLESAVMAGDEKAIKRFSHSLAGAAGNLGIMQIHAAAKDIEVNVAQYSRERLLELVRKIAALLKEIESQL
jgi:histidine phosphotransfer protein HptB